VSWLVMKAFGMEFAVVFAIIIAVLNYIPYFGSFAGVAFPVAAGLVEFTNPGTTFWLGVALTLVQFAIGNIIQPRVMGTSLNLSPWMILVGLTFWTSLWGIAGAVFSVPILAVAVVILSEFDATRPVAVLISQKGVLPPTAAAKKPPAAGGPSKP
jgi:predicted PurR-regulated permease PerM